ncbi:MAG: hypothetical protein LBD02_04355 [Christensenellaceae bacterium]|jgi:ParB family chromosome partitioning protein|nr:hypothetical protein [Christensenellaceae bacterium]
MEMEALNHTGVKADKHSCVVMMEQTDESAMQIFRYIRLTELTETLLDTVDGRQLELSPVVEISHLSYDEQCAAAEAMERYDCEPSPSQAVRLKKTETGGSAAGGKD